MFRLSQRRFTTLGLALVLFTLLALSGLPGCGPDEGGASSSSFPAMGFSGLMDEVDNAQGRVVVVNFWATWCNPCRMELGELVKLREAHGQDELLLLGLSVDRDASALPAFFGSKSLNYPIFHAKKDVVGQFGVNSVPHFVIFGPDGNLVYDRTGYLPAQDLSRMVNELLGG